MAKFIRAIPSIVFLMMLFSFPSISGNGETFGRVVDSPVINPGCNCSDTFKHSLVYVRSEGPVDTLHYVYSNLGAPTLLLTRSSKTARLSFNWTKLCRGEASVGGLTFNDTKSLDTVGVIFSHIIRYNDTKDEADLTDGVKKVRLPLTHTSWENCTVNGDGSIQMVISGNSTNMANQALLSPAGSITFTFRTHAKDGRSKEMPRLAFTANSTEMDLELSHMYIPPSSNGTGTRYGVELQLLSNEGSGKPMEVSHARSMDDEYSPGVFKLYDWQVNPKNKDVNHRSGYLQWKPVSYTSSDRGRANLNFARVYDVRGLSSADTPFSVLNFYTSETTVNSTWTVAGVNVTFGLSEDKFYNDYDYSVWTVSCGLGKPPVDAVSTLVIIVILVGLGVPVLLIAVGGVVVIVKRRPKTQTGYDPIQ